MNLSQSSVKDFQGGCPRRWYNVWVEGNKTSPNYHMVRGQYFETQCIGSGAHRERLMDLPRLKSGEKSADHLRIDTQVQRFKDLGLEITDTQLRLNVGNYEGTLDFVTKGCIWDLKLTGDLDGYWSGPQEYLQQIFYGYLFEKTYGYRPENKLLIMEYGSKLRIKQVDIQVSDRAIEEVLAKFAATEDMIEAYMAEPEFPRIATVDECKQCPLFCDKRISKPGIIYEKVQL